MKFDLEAKSAVYRVDQPIELSWKLHNDTHQGWVVYSGSSGNYDAVSVLIDGPSGVKKFPLSGPRTASMITACYLSTGEMLERSFDLDRFARIFDYKFAPGKYIITATYDHSAQRWKPLFGSRPVLDCTGPGGSKGIPPNPVWNGVLTSPKIEITLR